MQIKNVIIDNSHYINFIMFNISLNFVSLKKFSWFALLKLECVLYACTSYMPSNTVTPNNAVFTFIEKNSEKKIYFAFFKKISLLIEWPLCVCVCVCVSTYISLFLFKLYIFSLCMLYIFPPLVYQKKKKIMKS